MKSRDLFSHHTVASWTSNACWVSSQAFSLHYTSGAPDAMEQALKKLCEDVEKAVADGLEIVVLSDRISKEEMDLSRPPIPTLLAVGAVHHHLIR